MAVRLISDSACDISQSEAKELNITVLPLKTLIDGVEYLDGVTITTQEFYDKLETCKELPTTSQICPAEFEEVFRPAVENGDEVVVISIAGKLSGTLQSAVIAAADFSGKVWIVDSESVTIGQRILIMYAVGLRDKGLSGREIAEELNRIKSRVCLLARVDTLEYLVRGGRLSKTAGFAGAVLNIKPVLSVEDGEVKVIGKARGSRQGDNMLTEFIKQKGGVDFNLPVMLAYSGTDDALLKGYIDNSRALWEGHLDSLPVTMIGSTISTHAGPGAIAAAFFADKQVK
ncbi:MAG: DegV family protein [Lachnospiraceae bacterium]|nr:DegV family protein [Lachnospiraceae bacterium]